MASVRIEFRTNARGGPVATYTTTNTSETEVIQTGLQCVTYYYITVVVTGSVFTIRSREVQVLVGGKKNLCTIFYQPSYNDLKVSILSHRYT